MTHYREAHRLPQHFFSRYGTSVGFRDEACAFGSSRYMLYVLVAERHHRTEHGNCKHTSKKVIGVSNDKDALLLGANNTLQRGAPFASTHFFPLRYLCQLSGRSLCVWKFLSQVNVLVAVRHHRTEHGNWKYTSNKVIGVSNDKDALY